jgi:hypothetical protein
MSKETQISGFISRATKAELDRIVRLKGLKKGRLLEDALRIHLRALVEIPDEFIVPPSLIVTRESFERVVEAIRKPSTPTAELRRLMRGDPVSDDGLA